MCSANSLIILGCSRRKRRTSRLLPAIDRYDGPTFRVLRRCIADQPELLLGTYILSARFGLVRGDYQLPPYDRSARSGWSSSAAAQISLRLGRAFAARNPRRVFVCVGRRYGSILEEPLRRMIGATPLTVAEGGIGARASRLRYWLNDEKAPLEAPAVHANHGEATLLGTTVRKTRTEILTLARRELARNPAAARRFETWCVAIGPEDVAAKWLVALLFKRPVSRFRTADALRVLAALGLAARYCG